MYICTVTGRISKTLIGNEVNRGLSHEYLYVNTTIISSYNLALICYLLQDLRDCLHCPYGFGSTRHTDLIAALQYIINHPYED